MIRLIKNEFKKVKKSKLFFSQILLVISLILINKYSKQNILKLSFNLIPFIGVFLCIFYGGTISGEIENGSFRFYLTKPFKRWKILLSKYLCMFIYVIVTIIIIILCSLIINNKIDYNYLINFMKHCFPLFFMISFVIYLSCKFKNQSVCVGLSILILAFSLIISQLFFGFNINIVEYTFLPYLDFSIFDDPLVLNKMNNDLNINLSMNKGIIIDTIYMILFYILANRKFIKKDIKN